jgi:hypothetical protein
MAKRGSGFGMVMLVVVLAVVLLLAARSWRSLAPAAMQVSDPELGSKVDDHGQAGAGAAVRSGQLPDLNDMRQQTDAHSQDVQDALKAIE